MKLVSKIILAVVVGFLLFGEFSCRSDDAEPPPPPVNCTYDGPFCEFEKSLIPIFEITSPQNNEEVSIDPRQPSFFVEGKSEGIYPKDNCYKIVLLVYPVDPPGGDRWYPQCDLGQVAPNGDWFVTGYLGDTDTHQPKSGDVFNIKAYVTNKADAMLEHNALPGDFHDHYKENYISSNVVLSLRVK